MPSRFVSVLVVLTASLLMAAAPTLIIPPTVNLTDVEINWTAAPTSSEKVCAETIWLDHLAFSVAGDARTVTATDAQGSPITWMTAIPLSANQLTLIALPSKGIRMQGGFYLTASGSGVVYQFRGRVKR